MKKIINLFILFIVTLTSVKSQAMYPTPPRPYSTGSHAMHQTLCAFQAIISNQSTQPILVSPQGKAGTILFLGQCAAPIEVSSKGLINTGQILISSAKGVNQLCSLTHLPSKEVIVFLSLARANDFVLMESIACLWHKALSFFIKVDDTGLATFVDREGVQETDEKLALLLEK
ncbi:MAG: hypothetical protein AB7F19_02470 [Candidatus Babeliales bacterium]